MISIKYSEIPSYLHASELYKSFDKIDDSVLTLPQDCFKIDPAITTIEEFDFHLKTINFWVLNCHDRNIMAFCLDTKRGSQWYPKCPQFNKYPYAGYYNTLKNSKPTERIQMAMTWRMNITFVKDLHELGSTIPSNGCELAALNGCLELLQYFHSHGCILTTLTARLAAQQRDISLLEYLHLHSCEFDREVPALAAYSGNLPNLKFLHQVVNSDNFDATFCMVQCCMNGRLECWDYLYEHGGVVNWHLAATAAENNQPTVMIHAHKHGAELNDSVVHWACVSGSVKCLEYLIAQGCALPVNACVLAAEGGFRDCLQFLVMHGAPLNMNVCDMAALYGHLPCLQLAHELGCPWSYRTIANASWNSNWECVTYARAHGCQDPRILMLKGGILTIFICICSVYIPVPLLIAIPATLMLAFSTLFVFVASYFQVLQQWMPTIDWTSAFTVMLLITLLSGVIAAASCCFLALIFLFTLLQIHADDISSAWHTTMDGLKYT